MKQRDLINELIDMGWRTEDFAELLNSLKKMVEEENKFRKQERREKIEFYARRTLEDVGIPFNLTGRRYLLTAIIYCVDRDEERIPLQLVYYHVAFKYGVSKENVERVIRYAIECAFDNYNLNLEKIFGYTVHKSRGVTKNGEFIYGLSSHVRTLVDKNNF